MQREQWKSASEQLLKHWQRSGISHIPSKSQQSDPKSVAWLNEHAVAVYETNSPSTETLEQFGSRTTTGSKVKESNLLETVNSSSPSQVSYSATDEAKRPGLIEAETGADQVQKNPKVETNQVVARSAPEVRHQSQQKEDGLAIGEWETKSLATAERVEFLTNLNDQVTACRKCEDIFCKRQRTVFGVGAVRARVAMFGEAPGADEDRIGEPFVGAAGQLLDKILVASGLKRPEVYILNALKCRPPNNRTPTEVEIENCRPFFESQLESIQPEYIVCWGAVAVRAVLKSTESVGRLRGRFHSFRGAKVMVTYHPAYLLRNPDAKRLTWDDMKMLIKDMGLQIPAKSN